MPQANGDAHLSDNIVLERLRDMRNLLGEVHEDTADPRLRIGMTVTGYAAVHS